ncbi:MAG: molecular chaperone HtpG [Ruminococcaceae bacterium]|nr:molecular chaperone HtpG [Oscillospiraceae bacterium]
MAKKQFKAESKRLLDLMINSIYTHKEIFLRELISNASDAIDKLAYLSLTDDKVGLSRSDFEIRLTCDKKYKVLTVTDNGIGMNKEDLEQNLGTIARSGSAQFKKDMDKLDEVDIIGQFGVGFYSAFMVADHVTVVTKKYGEDQAWMWQSSGADGYTITECEREGVGTDVVLKLKDDTDDEKYSRFCEPYEIQSLVRKYSDYIRYPIRMEMETSKMKEGTEDKPEYETVTELKTLNSMVPLWQRQKKDVSQEEYNEFYKKQFADFEDPIATVHTSVEGGLTYKALLFIPKRAPYDFYSTDYKKGLQLYSSGVLIDENCADLLPEHFRFVRGVVDSQDLSLNISREMLQHDRQLKLIAANLEKKIKAELSRLLKDEREKYEEFYAAFGRQLKIGIASEFGRNKDLLQDLALFWSGKNEKLVTLGEYVASMSEGQEKIYFATGESKGRIAKMAQVELLLGKGYDVLLLTDEVDEFVARTIGTYAEKTLCNALTDELNLQTEEEKQHAKEQAESLKSVTEFVAGVLEGKVKEVRLSPDLGTHPASLRSDSGMSFEMERYLHRVNPDMAEEFGRVLELNADHKAVKAMADSVQDDPERAKSYAKLLYAQACLGAGLPLEDPAEYTDLVWDLMLE